MHRPTATNRAALCAALLLACAGARPEGLGLSAAGLAPCPASPNCVSSDASSETHAIAAFRLGAPPAEAWRVIREEVDLLPRTRVVRASESYIHAECTSRLLRFVDDLEIHLRPDENLAAVRSASRLGHSDLGVNRRRVERLRERLRERGAVR